VGLSVNGGVFRALVPHCFMAVSLHFFMESPCVEDMVVVVVWSFGVGVAESLG